MTAALSSAHTSHRLKLDPDTFEALRVQRDSCRSAKLDERRDWYATQLLREPPESRERRVSQEAQRVMDRIVARLDEASRRGESSVSYDALHRHESVGWKYVRFENGHVTSGPLDISMQPCEHTVRIETITRVATALTEAGLQCEIRRVPDGCENCFLEELSLKVTIP